MEFEEHEEEMGMGGGGGASYVDESLANPSRVKMPSPVAEEPMMVLRNNSFKGWYRECLKNHAVGIGGHALDGCCEFMAAGAEGTIDALKCAACNCHRNFHRKEIPPPPAAAVVAADPFHPFHHRRHQPPQFAACYRTPAGYLHVTGPPRGAAAPAALALPSTSGAAGGAAGGAHSPGEDHEDHENGGGSSSKKRFRTKFTQEQKEKMLVLAERLGWRMQKHDEGLVQEFCNETGVKRQVLKVWMHNNKHTLGKKP